MLDFDRLPPHFADREPAERNRLLRADQLERWVRGQPLRIEDYVQRLAFLQDDTAGLLDLILQEIQIRRLRGETPSLTEYIERFPAVSALLPRQLAILSAYRASVDDPTAPLADLSAIQPRAGEPQATIFHAPSLPPVLSNPTRPTPEQVVRDFRQKPKVPGYEVERELGRGGMGVVYLARQISLKRPVALKMILSGVHSHPELQERFRAEAEAVARLNHPHIVQVYEVGEHDGLPYLALEYVDGGSLSEKLRTETKKPIQSAELIETLARAMHHAHQQGVVHRDLKPQNILLRKDGAPVITDFGLAKRLNHDSSSLTATGAVLGTASYMAPEQAAGRNRSIGPATDIYAIGVILYELLAGQPPFEDDSFQATILRVLHDLPLPPSRLRPEVPPELEAVCLKCLEKEPQARFASAADLAEEMRRFRMGQTVQTAPLQSGFWLSLWASRAGFKLVEQVGRSNRTEVHRARQVRMQREIALKIIRGDTSDRRELLDRLEMQAVTSSLAVRELRQKSPYGVPIVEIYDLGERDGLGYCAMEFVEHGALAQKMMGKPWSIKLAVELVQKVADALRLTHSAKLYHGNLKPSNILLTSDGSPKLTDFVPPQQDPQHQAKQVAADILALGRILHALLTGNTVEQMAASQNEELPALSKLRPDAPRELETLCLRCLASNPRHRFERMSDLATDLATFLQSFREHGKDDAQPPITAAVGNYEPLELLGRGRVGPVYKARVKGTDRIVALQWFEPRGHVSSQDRAYFRATLESERFLQHPYIRTIEEIGDKGDKTFVVSEYLAGGALSARMKGKLYPPAEAAWLVENLAEAVHYAHGQGICHGDLSPDKILLTADDVPKLADFRVVAELVRKRRLPSAGPLDIMLESRPGYKPPEYLKREPLQITAAADVFSLGALLFELLTGRAPQMVLEPESFQRTGNRINLQKAAELTSPSRWVANSPPELDKICRCCLDWQADNRYSSAGAVAKELRRFSESLPGHAPKRAGWLGWLMGG